MRRISYPVRNNPLSVILIGPLAAGKSSLAPRLAQALGWAHIDLDQAMSDRVNSDLSEWITARGWKAFRALECETLANATRRGNHVIACGAGIVESQANHAGLRAAHSITLWLDIEPNEQERRLLSDTSRPRLEPGQSLIQELHLVDKRRRALYSDLSDQRFDAAVAPDQLLSTCFNYIQQWLDQPTSN